MQTEKTSASIPSRKSSVDSNFLHVNKLFFISQIEELSTVSETSFICHVPPECRVFEYYQSI